MKVAIYTLGCKVNQYETQAMEQTLRAKGHQVVEFSDEADAYVVNTCSVTAVSDQKSRQVIHRVQKQHPAAVVAVCGCYPQTHPEDVRKLGADLIAGTGDREGFISLLEEAAAGKKKLEAIDKSFERRVFEVLPAGGMEGRTRAMLKIEDGCVNFCTYCIIPYARGPVRSLSLEQAVEQTRQLAAEGYREIVLTGIEISSWGHDSQKRPKPYRPAGGPVRRSAGGAPAAGQSGAPHCDGGLLPPGGGAAEPVPPVPPVHAERVRCHLEADEPEVRYRPVSGIRGTAEPLV